MRYRFISERCKILGLLLLLAAGSAVLRAQDQPGIKKTYVRWCMSRY